jgi:hypothetical protein
MRHFVLCSRRFALSSVLFVILLGWTAPVGAQGIGFEGGATVDPNQPFVGTHFETGQLLPGLRFRPGVDGGFSSNLSIASINLEFLYSIPLKSGWALYQGGGPAIVLERVSVGSLHDTSTHGGTFYTFGFAHESGFFTEFKVGGGYSPNLRFGAGYTVRKKKP